MCSINSWLACWAFIFINLVVGLVNIEPRSCAPNYDVDDESTVTIELLDLQRGLREARAILEYATSPEVIDTKVPRVNNLYRSLFLVDSFNIEAKYIQDDFKKIIQVMDNPNGPHITMYCDEGHIQRGPTGDWQNIYTGRRLYGSKVPAEQTKRCLARVGRGQTMAYATNLDVIICTAFTAFLRKTFPYTPFIELHWMSPRHPRENIDDWQLLGHTIVHELLHATTMMRYPGVGMVPRILDYTVYPLDERSHKGERVAYSFADCMELARSNRFRYARNCYNLDDPPTKPCFDNANSLALLATGLYLRNSDWSAGYARPLVRQGGFIYLGG